MNPLLSLTLATVCWLAMSSTAPATEVTGKVSTTSGLPGALVRVVSVLPSGVASPSHQPPVVTIRNGKFEPQTLVVLTNEPFTITNTSGVLYNVHMTFTKPDAQHIALAASPIAHKTILVPRPQLFVPVLEDLHRLNGYICIVENSFYAVADANGAFKLPDLPPGTYTLEAAHPRTGQARQEVKIAGASATVDCTLPLRSQVGLP